MEKQEKGVIVAVILNGPSGWYYRPADSQSASYCRWTRVTDLLAYLKRLGYTHTCEDNSGRLGKL